MSYHPARGRLRERTPGVDRSQAVLISWGARPRQGDWSDLWLNVIMRRTAISDRRLVTAAECVYSIWQFYSPLTNSIVKSHCCPSETNWYKRTTLRCRT